MKVLHLDMMPWTIFAFTLMALDLIQMTFQSTADVMRRVLLGPSAQAPVLRQLSRNHSWILL